MGRKDMADRPYFSDCRRFAELANTMLYGGRPVVLPENLLLRKGRYSSLSSAGGETERDVLMEDTSQNICYGLEIETESDLGMPERVMAYDACEYEYQIKRIDKRHRERRDYADYRERKSRMKESDFLLPMVTAVLYLGEGRWEGRRKLTQMCRIPVELRKLLGKNFHDYDFPLMEADYVNPEIYGTDLREFFQAMQCRRDRKKLRALFQAESFQNLGPETEFVIARHLNITSLVHKMEKEDLPMCKAFQDLIEEQKREGKQEGRREGKKEGKREEKHQIIRRMLKGGCEEEFICKMTNCTRDEFAAAAGR